MNTQTSNRSLVLGLFYVMTALALSLCAGAAFAQEGPVIRSGETVGIEADQLLEGDFYGMGQKVTLSGEAKRDVYALGGTVTTNAPVQEDLVVVGGVVQIHGEIKDDARIIGGEVVIAESVGGDVVVIGGSVHILSTASIAGDLIFLGSEIHIDGPVEGTVYGTGEAVRINAHVGGDVTVRTVSSLILGDSAEVLGNITYKSTNEIVRAPNAVVGGDITRDEIVPKDSNGMEPIVLTILLLIFSSLTVFFLAKNRTGTLVEGVMANYGRLGLIGLVMLLALPIIAVILMASVIGFMVGLILLLSYVLLLVLALMFMPILFGALLQRLIRLGDTISIYTVFLGVFAMLFLPLIPVVGGFLLLLALVVLLGAFCSELYGFFKNS